MKYIRCFMLVLVAICSIQGLYFFSHTENKNVSSVVQRAKTDALKIKKIQVKGAERTENSTIISYITLEKQQQYDKSKADTSLKNLYATGFFANVDISFNKGVVTIVVEENPIITSIEFEGNHSLKSEELSSEISLRPRGYFSKSKLQSDKNRILELYSKIGVFAIAVHPKVTKLPQNRVSIKFDVEEGTKMRIQKISFIGNKKFSDSDLRWVIFSKENRIFNLFRMNYYNPDAIEYDKIVLKKFYGSKGYADFKVVSVNVEMMPSNMEKAYVTFVVEEGARYDFGKIKVDNNISSIKEEDLLKLVTIKEGAIFNGEKVEDINSNIIRYLSEKGFPFVNVEYDYKLDKVKKLVSVTYKISKAPKVYIGKINISGNEKTYDYVIRRQFRLSEGDPYNGFLVDRSTQRIRNLDYFEKVDVKPSRTNEPSIVDIDVKVEEKSTAQMKLSGGWSSHDGVLIQLGFVEKNFLGRGQHAAIGFNKNAFVTSGNIGYSEPHFLGTEVEVGGTLRAEKEKNDAKGIAAKTATVDHSKIAFNQESYVGSIYMSYDILEHLSHNVDYSLAYAKNTISGEWKDKILPIFRSDLGRKVTSSVGHTVVHNVADSAIKPTRGYVLTLNQTLAGLGGDVKHLRHIAKGAYYYPVMEDLTLKLAGEGGYVHKTDKKRAIGISDNFTLGHNSFKGFEHGGVGARDKETGRSLGSTQYYRGTVELQFPFPGLSKDADLTASVFSEFGAAWGLDIPKNITYKKNEYHDSKVIRSTAGVGLIWITAMGPLRIDLAWPLKKKHFDRDEMFLFSFATAL